MSSVAQAAMDWKGLRMKSKGEPLDVLVFSDLAQAPDPAPGQVLVRMIAAPVNPRYSIALLLSLMIVLRCVHLGIDWDPAVSCSMNSLLSSP